MRKRESNSIGSRVRALGVGESLQFDTTVFNIDSVRTVVARMRTRSRDLDYTTAYADYVLTVTRVK